MWKKGYISPAFVNCAAVRRQTIWDRLTHFLRDTFLPGHTAHRAIRKRRAIRTLISEVANPEDLNQILANRVQEALKDPAGQWAMFIASKMVANPKPESSPIELTFGSTDSPVEMGKSIMHAVAAGEVNPDAAQALLSSLASLNSMIEVESLAAEVEGLKELLTGAKTV